MIAYQRATNRNLADLLGQTHGAAYEPLIIEDVLGGCTHVRLAYRPTHLALDRGVLLGNHFTALGYEHLYFNEYPELRNLHLPDFGWDWAEVAALILGAGREDARQPLHIYLAQEDGRWLGLLIGIIE